MDQRTRKLMTIPKALYPRDDVNRQYVSRKKVGRGLASVEDNFDASIKRHEYYIEKQKGRLMTAIRNDTSNTMDNRMIILKQKWEEQLYGCFKRLINNISHDKTWTRRRKGTLREKQNLF